VASDPQRSRHPYLIEWDIQSAEPVKGALAIQPILPAHWPKADAVPPPPTDSPWLTEQVYSPPGSQWGRMDELTKALADQWTTTPHRWMSDINCRLLETITGNGFGWLFRDRVFPGAKTTGFGMLCRAKLRVPNSGTYTFDVHADDGYAIRIGDRPWTSVHGQGGIDPQDPKVLYFMLFSPDGDTRGVIDLPAGDHPIEVFYFNVGLDGALQIMVAPGRHPMDGATDKWRLLGHHAAGKIGWPGMDETGWKVTVQSIVESPGTERRKASDTVGAIPKAKVAEGVEVINFHDPEAANPGRFPAARPFPDDGPGAQDARLVVAAGKLVISREGTYHIGLRGDDACAVQIENQSWIRTVKDVSGSTANIEGDKISVNGRGNMPGDHEIIGEIRLAKGTYPIVVSSEDRTGPSVFQVFAAPAGYPGRMLRKGGSVEEDDVPGLELLPFSQP
jgi:PA14 domain